MAVMKSVVFSRYGRISYVKSRRRFRSASLRFWLERSRRGHNADYRWPQQKL